MALDITQLRNAFAKKSEQAEGNVGFWDKFYPFYKMGFDEVATFRFLPDLDEDNPLGFIVENKYHELTINSKKKRIACLKMFGESCPCCELSSKYYNDGDTRMGKAFWRKIDYVAQGVIVHTPFEYPIKAEENPVRLVSMSKQLYEKLETEIVKGDLDNMPYDMQAGYDFRIIKNKKTVPGENGAPAREFGNYSDSGFARKSTPVPEALLGRIELLDLKNYRFTKIEADQMENLIEAFLTGKNYEETKPEAGASSTGSPALDAKIDAPKPTQNADTVIAAATSTPAPAADGAAPKLSPQEILRKLKERQAASA